MLVLSRQVDQRIMIGDDIVVTVVRVAADVVRIGIDAPRTTAVHREEIYNKIKEADGGDSNPTLQPDA